MSEEELYSILYEYLDLSPKLLNEPAREAYEKLMKYINYLQQENQKLKENNQALQEKIAKTWAKLDKKKEIINKAKEYINKTKYSDIVGLNSYGIKEFWFIKDLLEILKEVE